MAADAEVAKAIAELQKEVESDKMHIFRRKQEMTQVLERATNSSRLQFLLGPMHAGKSAILREFRRLWKTKTVLKTRRPLFHLNLRDLVYQTEEGAAKYLRRRMKKWVTLLKSVASALLKVKVTVMQTSVDLSGLSELLDTKAPAFEEMMAMIIQLGTSGASAVWIMDEFQLLQRWGDDKMNHVATAFIRATKENHRCTVFLSSSDDLFMKMFAQGHHALHTFFAIGIGYFSEADSRAFLQTCMGGMEVSEDTWTTVFGAVGGCPKLLEEVAQQLKKGRPVQDICGQQIADGCLPIAKALGDPNWDTGRYRAILGLIVGSEDGSVSRSQITKHVYGGDDVLCTKELLLMVKSNVLHHRYHIHCVCLFLVCRHTPMGLKYSDLKPRNMTSIYAGRVMALTPAHRAAMKSFLAGGFDDEDEWVQ